MAKFTGLSWDEKTGQGRVRKMSKGVVVTRRFHATTRSEAEAIYYQVLAVPAKPKGRARTFRAAATHFLETETKKSMERDTYALEELDPHIGNLPLEQIHQGTIQGFIAKRKADGVSSGTVRRELAVVRRILKLAALYWRDEAGKPWLEGQPPMFRLPDWDDKKKPYPISHDEERRLLSVMPQHLSNMTLFALYTGARESVIAQLRWEWLNHIKEIDRYVFLVPGDFTKNGTDCLIPLNIRVQAMVLSLKDTHPERVFVYRDKPVLRMHNSGWKLAWKKAGLPMDKTIQKGPHDMRHTFARRLRSAMVPHEVIKALLHHVDGDVTINYAPAQLEELFRAVDAILEQKTLLRVVNSI